MAMAQRGPAAARDDNRGDIDIEPKLVSGNSAEKALLLLRQLISQSRKSLSLVREIKRRLGPVSEAGVSGATTAVKDLNIRGNKHD